MAQVTVVDDDRDLTDLIRQILELEDHSVSSCHSPAEAIESISAQPPGLILLDLAMGEAWAGLRVLHFLRKDDRLRSVPVVIMTAKAPYQLAEHPEVYTASEILMKPFELVDLTGLVTRFTGHS